MSNDIVTEAVRIDTEIAHLIEVEAKLARKAEWAANDLHRAAGHTHDWKTQSWSGTITHALSVNTASSAAAEFVAANREWAEAVAATQNEQDKYTGWSRFYLVTNSNGHIHNSSLRCSTCVDTTQFAWLTQLSGLTEADAVADQGEILCSVCFPSAPVAWTTGRSKVDNAARAARAQASADRYAKKVAKAINADLTPLRISKPGGHKYETERIDTISAAKSRLTDTFDYDHLLWMRQPIAEALAFRLCQLGQDTTPEAQIEAARIRNSKRK